MIVAAHPDDEVIGVGAGMGAWPGLSIVHVTDGAPRDMRDARAHGFGVREEYAAVRRQEACEALSLAGVSPASLFALGAVDQEATLQLPLLSERLASLIEALAPRTIITHPYEGGHPDHDATAFIVHAASALAARDPGGPRALAIYEFTSYHAAPPDGGFEAGRFLRPNEAACAAELGELDLPLGPAERERKRRMLACFATQRRVLEAFPVEDERLRPAPRYDFRRAPHRGPLYYERFGWGRGDGFRSRAAAALAALRLSAPL
jgi:LmbE family N-acetylglucosaminyl deacetylase